MTLLHYQEALQRPHLQRRQVSSLLSPQLPRLPNDQVRLLVHTLVVHQVRLQVLNPVVTLVVNLVVTLVVNLVVNQVVNLVVNLVVLPRQLQQFLIY